MTNVRFVVVGTVLMSPRSLCLPARTLVMAGLARNCAGLPSGQCRATFRSDSVPQKLLAAFTSRLRPIAQTKAVAQMNAWRKMIRHQKSPHNLAA